MSRMSDNLPKYVVLGLLAAGVAVIGYRTVTSSPSGATVVEVKVPERLSRIARAGKQVFDKNCASCHGMNAAGSDKGPPLVHDIYNPGHHADQAFYRAAKTGVPQHHWRFGNMPPQPQMDRLSMQAVIQYVRELQLANGIVYREHRM